MTLRALSHSGAVMSRWAYIAARSSSWPAVGLNSGAQLARCCLVKCPARHGLSQVRGVQP